MKDKMKRFWIEKKELIIFIGVVIFVFATVITVATIALNDNSNTASGNDASTTGSTTTATTSTSDMNPEVVMTFSLPLVGDYEKVRIFFDTELSDEELEAALIDTGTNISTSKGISYAKADNSVFDVLAVYDGEVISIDEDELAGSKITIKHSEEVYSIYSSLEDVLVSVGDTVTQGTQLASASTSINDVAAGVHVHLQIEVNGVYVNPDEIIGREIAETTK